MGLIAVSKRIFTNRWFIIGAAVVAAYSLAGFFLVPYLARHYLNKHVEQRLGHELILKKLRFNPFSLKIEAEKFGVQEKGDSPLVTLGFFSADFGLFSSLYHRAWTFSEIRMIDPHVFAVVDEGGRSALFDLFKDQKGKDEEYSGESEAVLPRILFEEITLRGGDINFFDQRKSPPVEVHLKSVAVDVEELTTLPDMTGGYIVSGRMKGGGNLKWRGTVSFNPLRSKGSFRIEAVKVAKVWEFVKEIIRCELPPGEVTLASDYLFDMGGEESVLTLNGLDFEISNLSVTLRGEQSPMMSLNKAFGKEGELQWNERSFSLEALRVEGGVVRAEVDETGLANWRKLAGEEKGKESHAEEGASDAERPLTEWSVLLRSFEAKEFQVHLTDLTTDPPASVTLDPVGLSLAGVSTNQSATVDLELHAGIREGGQITAKGKAAPWSHKAQGHVQIKGFSLLPLQPYLNRWVRVTLESGSADASGEFGYGQNEGSEKFTFKGKGKIVSLQAQTREKDGPPRGWESLSCPEIHLGLYPHVLELGDVRVEEPSGRLIINEDGSVNLSQIIIQKEEEEKEESPEKGFKFAAERVRLERGSLEFADLRLRPQFGVLIHELQGSVTGISSIPGVLAKVELEGRVDKHGIARITGETDLFRPTGTTEIEMDFRNIEMTALTPYSVRFAGCRIASGKLSLDLSYIIQQGKMEGRNQIIAEQFTLGERVESPTALDLPFELAVALLKDSSGTIDIGLPISGDLRNPQFDFGEVIGKAMANLLKKIVTAPFAWLAALVGSGKEDLDTISFDPGKATLLPPEKEKLINLSKALTRRPRLRLQIQGGYDPEVDIPALKTLQMRNRLASEMQQALKPEEDPGPVVFHSRGTQKALEELFLEHNPPEALSKLRDEFQETLQHEKKRLDKEEQAAAWTEFYKELYRGLEERVNIPESRLKELAEERAVTTGEFLVFKERVDIERIEVLKPTQTESKDGKEVISKLSLDVAG